MKRCGRSVPAGPAMTPQASSGWSALACATIRARSDALIVSMTGSVARAPPGSGQRLDQALLEVGQPVVDPHVGGPRVGRVDPVADLLEIVGDAEPHPEGQPDVVQRPQPGLGVGL